MESNNSQSPPVPARAGNQARPASPSAGGPGLVILGIVAAFAWIGMTAGLGMFAALMMAFMSDSGLKDKELQEGALLGTLIAIGFFGLAGIPLGIGIAARRIRKTFLKIAGGIAGLGLLAAVVGFAVYFSAFLKGSP